MPEEFAKAMGEGTALSAAKLFVLVLQLVVAFAFGCVSAWIHYQTAPRGRSAERSLMATLVLLSVLIAVVTIVVANNLARAFSLAGVLAIVRFRTVVEDTRDISFVIYSVVAGMAVGSEHYWEPALMTPFVWGAARMFQSPSLAKPPSHGVLVLRLAAGRPVDERVDEILRRYVSHYHLVGLTTARGGSALDASYAISLPAADKVFAMVSELGKIETIQGVEVKDE